MTTTTTICSIEKVGATLNAPLAVGGTADYRRLPPLACADREGSGGGPLRTLKKMMGLFSALIHLGKRSPFVQTEVQALENCHDRYDYCDEVYEDIRFLPYDEVDLRATWWGVYNQERENAQKTADLVIERRHQAAEADKRVYDSLETLQGQLNGLRDTKDPLPKKTRKRFDDARRAISKCLPNNRPQPRVPWTRPSLRQQIATTHGTDRTTIPRKGRTNLKSNTPVAIKFEPRKAETPQLRDEYRTYKILAGQAGVPQCYYFGQEGLHSVLVIDLLGPSLEDVFDLCGRNFTLKTVCMMAKRMIKLIQVVHESNLVYRDIKPDNFLIGRIPRYNDKVTEDPASSDPYSIVLNHSLKDKPSAASMIYIVDFGMVKQYRDPRTLVHIPYREKKSLSGTARYMSIHTHLGREQGRRDDIEALCHVFFYLLNSHLPWQGLKANSNRQKYERIGEVKQAVAIEDLGRPNPVEFGYLLEYARNMQFDEEPNYDGLCEMINQVMRRENLEDDGVFDWMAVLDQQRALKRQREEARAAMSEEARREDDRREREERVERERSDRADQEMRRVAYEKQVLLASPKLRETMGSYFSTFQSTGSSAPAVKATHLATNQSQVRTSGSALQSRAGGSAAAGAKAEVGRPVNGVPAVGASPAGESAPQAVASHAAGQATTPAPQPHQQVPAVVTTTQNKKKKKWWKRIFSCVGGSGAK
ncbi:casein kinase I [Thoreauomyces humboldtii]|nr:casein kinase I [Thoreauomyces humboldtii]